MNNDDLNDNIDLYFYHRNRQVYIDNYKKVQADRYNREKGYRYSPLFLLLSDAKYCFGISSQNRQYYDYAPPYFAGILLLDIILYTLIKMTAVLPADSKKKRDKITKCICRGFSKYEKLSVSQIKALRLLRNSLEHRDYSLSNYDEKKTKHFFALSRGGGYSLISELKNKRTYKSKTWLINVNRYYALTILMIDDIRTKLLNKRCYQKRSIFRKNYDLDNWVWISDPQYKGSDVHKCY